MKILFVHHCFIKREYILIERQRELKHLERLLKDAKNKLKENKERKIKLSKEEIKTYSTRVLTYPNKIEKLKEPLDEEVGRRHANFCQKVMSFFIHFFNHQQLSSIFDSSFDVPGDRKENQAREGQTKDASWGVMIREKYY